MVALRLCVAGLAAVAGAALLAGCGGSGRVSLAQLAQHQQSFAGKRVDTKGTVLEEHDPSGATYFVLTDGAGDLVGLKPDAQAKRYLGTKVDVTGRFRVESGFGRLLRIAAIAPARS